MNIFDIVYYQFFLFYKNSIKDPAPNFATILAISFGQSLLINCLIDTIAIKYFCYEVAVTFQFLVLLLLLLTNWWIYMGLKRSHYVIKSKPIFRNSRLVSKVITVLFFLISISWLFWGPIYGKHILEGCK